MPVVALTSQFVRGIKPPKSGRAEYWDQLTPGLCLRVTANGHGSWSYRYRPRESGKQNERITFGTSHEISLAEARDRAARVRAAVVDGDNPQLTRRQKKEAARNTLTLDALADRYLAEYAKPRKASWRDDAQRLIRAREAIGHKEVTSITRRELIGFLDEVKQAAPVQANRIQSVLCGLFNWAVEGEILDVNPIASLKKRAKETASTRTLSDAEIAALWRALEATKETAVEIATALRVLLLVGQRPGEVASAVQSELKNIDDPRNARWEIPAERMKARRPHVVPLASMARALFRDMLARRREEGDKTGLFASRFLGRATITRPALSRALRRVIGRMQPEGADAHAIRSLQDDPPSPHDFRRTVATGMAALGIAREDRLAVLAHQPSDIHGAVYDQYERLREKRIALETWERRIATMLGLRAPEGAAILPLRRGHDG
jgi:integrase